MTPEGKIKKQVAEVLAERAILQARDAGSPGSWEGWYYMPGQSGYGVKGIPDFIGHYKGAFFAIETKAPGKTPEGFQLLQLDTIHKTGGARFVVDGEYSLKMFERWLEGRR